MTRRLEESEQAVVVEWAALQRMPEPHEGLIGDFLYAIPNGAYLAGSEKQRAAQMARLKRTGLKPGVADLFLAVPCRSRGVAGFYIEMKKPIEYFRSLAEARAAVSREQQIFGQNALIMGYDWSVCYGADEAIVKIQAYLNGRG